MGAPAWTAKEISALEEMTAKYPLPTVARKLNRSVSAVFLKQQRLGIGGLRQNSDMITRNTLSKILGVENRTIKIWEAKGLKSIKKKPYIMYRHQDILLEKLSGSDPIKNGNLFESRKGFFFWTGHVYSPKSVVDAMLKELIYTQERIL